MKKIYVISKKIINLQLFSKRNLQEPHYAHLWTYKIIIWRPQIAEVHGKISRTP